MINVVTFAAGSRSLPAFSFRQVVWGLGLVLGIGVAQGAQPVPLAITPHKIKTSDPQAGNQILLGGGRLIADYGAFQVYHTAQWPSELPTPAATDVRDDYNLVLLNTGPLDTTQPGVRALRQPIGLFAGKRLHLVQFTGPPLPEWQQAVLATGAQIVSYIPQNTYLLYADSTSLSNVQALAASADFVQWDAPYSVPYRIHPAVWCVVQSRSQPPPAGTGWFSIQLVADPSANTNTLALLDQLKLEPLKPTQAVLNYLNVIARVSTNNLATVAQQPDVVSIQPYSPPRKLCERQAQIVAGNLSNNVPGGPGYLAWLTGKGFTQAQFDASGFLVDLSDSGVDNGTTWPNHLGLHVTGAATNLSRVAYSRLEGTPNPNSTLSGCDGHGTLNAHIIEGYNDLSGFPHADAQGFHYGLGICPFARLGSSVIFDPDNWTYPNFNNLQSEAYQSGARISNNSWGVQNGGLYDATAQNYDALVRDAQPDSSTFPATNNQQMVVVFSAGNQGIATPGTAKNVIAVGAAENVQPFGGPDGSNIGDDKADNATDVVGDFGSGPCRGPCQDGRHKPDLMAPGTHVSGGVVQTSDPGTNGMADPCFLNDGSGISGGPGGVFWFPLGQEFYTASSGSSASAACVSGACGLLRQYFINQFGAGPSPAMTKAYLLNSARYLTGQFANDTLWSDTQGLGELSLATAFDGVPRILRDQLDLFTSTGQTRTFAGTIPDPTRPLRVTLAWTDAPGSTAGSAFNNDLDLVVVAGGNTYKGNVFTGAWSTTGGSTDSTNNVETVLLPPGLSGNFVVKVIAANINSDGVPNNSWALDQDFALVIYNATPATNAYINAATTTLTAESCSPTNGAVDPGETVTLNFRLQNVGSSNTTSLVATLQTGGGVTSPSGPQTYGVLSAGGPPVGRPFSFTAVGACGGSASATLQLQDGSANLGTVTFTIPLGKVTPGTTFYQDFDYVAVPALPSGWGTAVSGGVPLWATTSAAWDTPTNSAFVPDSTSLGVSELVSPVISLATSTAQLTFKNYFDTEADVAHSVGYDGGVLEIKIGTNSFTDVTLAGGNFAAGGYTLGLSPSRGNPLAGRQAWSGSSGGFVTTIVNLPAAAAGQDVQFKWRFGTDSGNTNGVGWHIDSIALFDGTYSCCNSLTPPAIVVQPTNQTVLVGTSVNFLVSASGNPPLSYQWRFNGTDIAGASTNVLIWTNVQPYRTGGYSAVVANAAGSVTSAVAMLKVLVWPDIGEITVTRSNAKISCDSVSGLTYVLQYKNSLADSQWMNASGAVAGTGGEIYLTDTYPPAASRYYRIRCY
jgi:hypothetical protein